jgi:hypothetical protein
MIHSITANQWSKNLHIERSLTSLLCVRLYKTIDSDSLDSSADGLADARERQA